MATNSVKVTLQIRQDAHNDWITRNPVLAAGEYGLESDTLLIKIGDGVRDWTHLPYLNKLHSKYFDRQEDGSLTLSAEFSNTISTLEAAAGQAITSLTITDPPVNDTDVPNKKYVDDMIAAAGHLKREVVQTLPSAGSADVNTLYMILAQSGDHYEEYMVINGAWDMVGSTGDGGAGGFNLEIATDARLGGVKSAPKDNEGNILTDNDYITVNENTGFMTLNKVSTSRLYVPTGDILVIFGGTA